MSNNDEFENKEERIKGGEKMPEGEGEGAKNKKLGGGEKNEGEGVEDPRLCTNGHSSCLTCSRRLGKKCPTCR